MLRATSLIGFGARRSGAAYTAGSNIATSGGFANGTEMGDITGAGGLDELFDDDNTAGDYTTGADARSSGTPAAVWGGITLGAATAIHTIELWPGDLGWDRTGTPTDIVIELRADNSTPADLSAAQSSGTLLHTSGDLSHDSGYYSVVLSDPASAYTDWWFVLDRSGGGTAKWSVSEFRLLQSVAS